MIDHRIDTFLSLCKTNNYTETAQELNMTQPSVTQHIQYLEKYYQVQLVSKKGKQFTLTEEGKMLQKYAKRIKANSERITPLLHRIKKGVETLKFGATLTIGEYMMPPILLELFEENSETRVSMFVENTQLLLEMLWKGEIDFALLEGHFEQNEFDSQLISNETYIGLCSPDNPIANKSNDLQDLLSQNLIIREAGSGTRDILEHTLYNQNLSVENFNRTIEIGNMNAIKELCRHNMGITFMYREAVKKELEAGDLAEIPLNNFNISHPFSFVYLKNSPDIAQLDYWFNKMLTLRKSL